MCVKVNYLYCYLSIINNFNCGCNYLLHANKTKTSKTI